MAPAAAASILLPPVAVCGSFFNSPAVGSCLSAAVSCSAVCSVPHLTNPLPSASQCPLPSPSPVTASLLSPRPSSPAHGINDPVPNDFRISLGHFSVWLGVIYHELYGTRSGTLSGEGHRGHDPSLIAPVYTR